MKQLPSYAQRGVTLRVNHYDGATRVVTRDMSCIGYPDCPADGPDNCRFKREHGVTCDEAAMGARMPTDEVKTGGFNFDLSYDARRINWPRLWERVISSVINATFYGTLLVLAKMIGLM